MTKLVQHLFKTTDVLDTVGSRMDIILLALNGMNTEEQEKYYSTLAEEDLPHNMQSLFNELRTVHSMLYQELEALRDYRLELSKGDTDHVQ